MSNPLRLSEPWTTTAILTVEPTLPAIETGGVGQVVDPLGARQTMPVAACAEGSEGTTSRDPRIISGKISSVLKFVFNK